MLFDLWTPDPKYINTQEDTQRYQQGAQATLNELDSQHKLLYRLKNKPDAGLTNSRIICSNLEEVKVLKKVIRSLR